MESPTSQIASFAAASIFNTASYAIGVVLLAYSVRE
jgi:hypothetical protein